MQSEPATGPSNRRLAELMRRCVTWALRSSGTISAYIVAALLFATITAFVPGFGSAAHIRFLLLAAAFVGVVALGQTFVILGGGFDLSIPWTLNAVSTITTALCLGKDARLVWVLPLVFGMAALIGFINGVGVTLFRISPIIMTLAVNVIVQGLVILEFSGMSSTGSPPLIKEMVNGVAAGLPIGVWIWLLLALLATVLLSFTGFGRRLYAVGTNAEVSRFAGIDIAATRIATYVISGVCAGIAGLMLTGFIGESSLGFGDPYLFASVAAVAVGGASVLGGQGHYLGTVAGALILTFLTGLLPILNLTQGWLEIIYGLAILVTVSIANMDRFRVEA
jgi:ribose transport system permease protein